MKTRMKMKAMVDWQCLFGGDEEEDRHKGVKLAN